MSEVQHFLGCDFAQSAQAHADQGALVVLSARLRPESVTRQAACRRDKMPFRIAGMADFQVGLCYARLARGLGARQYASRIHQAHAAFGFTRIMIDPGAGGGGLMVQRELRAARQLIGGSEKEVTPIVSPDDPDAPAVSSSVLSLFSRGDSGIRLLWPGPDNTGLGGDDVLLDVAHRHLKDSLDQQQIELLPGLADVTLEQTRGWSDGMRETLRVCDELARQLQGIHVATMEGKDGVVQVTTGRGALKFMASGRKDVMMAFLYAHTALLCWFKLRELLGDEDDDDGGMGVW